MNKYTTRELSNTTGTIELNSVLFNALETKCRQEGKGLSVGHAGLEPVTP